ncbi:hypothetical protein ACFSKI_21070 [Pseudogracilibacillus auburnensis]|uniref:Holin n=1 Tax=Pseudogracilibacillus auburnensis TaxID=1494959 RepID=A0A2V3W0I2_9BACI|nr:hypothetical protein [Pseudogracilibacillus auburnensis]MBO1002629.1 hypothetical protein [Pseudogracilibacillus auburnensis]PXW86651.1 hypothetical protein DFR56_107173 [Pseudogracilibacillus auburnensis]
MFEVYDIAVVPLITGLVQLFKLAGFKAKYAPFIALLLGILFGLFYFGSSIKEGILIGLVLGLSASGLYSGSKNMLEKNKEE